MTDREEAQALVRQIEHDPSLAWLMPLVREFRRLVEVAKVAERRPVLERLHDEFLMMTESDRREITAREVEERHEEKMLMLGPVLERGDG